MWSDCCPVARWVLSQPQGWFSAYTVHLRTALPDSWLPQPVCQLHCLPVSIHLKSLLLAIWQWQSAVSETNGDILLLAEHMLPLR